MKKKRKSAKVFLRKTGDAFSALGLEKIVNERIKEIKASPPDVKSVSDRFTQLSFAKQVNYLTLKVRTSADEKTGYFNETGKIWVLVVSAVPGVGEKTVFVTYFKRRRGVEKRLIALVTALNFELVNRPSDSKGKLMNLEELSPRYSVWRSVNFKKNKEEKELFCDFLTNKHFVSFRKIVATLLWQWGYYQDIVRPRENIERRESEIRKKWDVEQPENAIPV